MYLDALVDQFLAQLQRRGVPLFSLRRIKETIGEELDKAHQAGSLVLDPIPSTERPTGDETPHARARTSSRRLALDLPPPPPPPSEDDDD